MKKLAQLSHLQKKPCCFLAHPGLPVGFLLLWYSVLCTVESYLCFIPFLYLDLYVLGDNSSINSTSKVEVSAVKLFYALQKKMLLLTVPRQYFFCGSFMLFVFRAFVIFSCLFVTCWERADHLALVCDVLL